MEEPSPIIRSVETEHGSVASYTTGFVLSIIFTLLAFVITAKHVLTFRKIMVLLIGLAIIQFVVQMLFFLHIGKETKPRWKRLLLFFMIVFVLIIILGSIWIMYNLNSRMNPSQINTYMLKQVESGL
ncbi:MAG TPA: cytochrome o ubiquinol oxidase subunit IV [Candidatus Saccharimonadales bacterium]|nr:cytochrome o ubiquinol oxidase subunit IV [Candidatus Saccharimonadales bacterium]